MSPTSLSAAQPFRRAVLLGYAAAAVALVLAAAGGAAYDGSAGALGAVLGVAVPVGFLSVTVVVGLVTLRLGPTALGATVLGSWLLKLILLIVVLVYVDRIDDLSREAFFVAFLVSVIGYLGLEAWVLVRARIPYLEPQSATGAPGAAAGGGRSTQ